MTAPLGDRHIIDRIVTALNQPAPTIEVFSDLAWQTRALQRIIDDLRLNGEPQLAALLSRYLQEVVDTPALARIVAQLQAGAVEPWDELDIALRDMDLTAAAKLYEELYTTSAKRLTDALRAQARHTPQPVRFAQAFRFDLSNDRAQRWAIASSAQLVTRIKDDVRLNLRTLVSQAVEGDMTPIKAARLIARDVGLIPQHRMAVRRFVANATQTVGPARAAVLGQRYARRLLNWRANTIARTEIMTAQNQGQYDLWAHKVDTRQLPGDVQKVWIITRDDRLCSRCSVMTGERALTHLHSSWRFPGHRGGDIEVFTPPGHPNCRCTHGIYVPEFFTGPESYAVLFGDPSGLQNEPVTVPDLFKLRRSLGAPSWMVGDVA